MVRGLMTHSDFADYYYFLGLEKYGDEHHERYVDESLCHRKLQKWYILHYNKLLPQERVDYKTFIPESWHKYNRFDVDSGTISKSVKTGLNMWVDWERETKKLYEQMYKELMTLDEITAAIEKLKPFRDSQDNAAVREAMHEIVPEMMKPAT